MPTFSDLLDRYAVSSWDKQESLFRLMGGDHEWRIDLGRGVLTLFNASVSHELPIQWLGTADRAAKLWLWSWANEEVEVPDELKDAARALQSYGEEHGLEQFTTAEFSLDDVNGDILALVASGMCSADGYYLCETENGAEYFLFKSDECRALGDVSPVKVMNVFVSILPHIELNHRQAFHHFLTAKGYECAEEGPAINAVSPAGEVFAAFDELGRVVELKTKVADKSPSDGRAPRPEVVQ